MAKKQTKPGFFRNFWDVLKKDTGSNVDSVQYREDTMALGIIASITAVVGVVAGAIALPVIYATGIGATIGLGFVGAVSGGVTGAIAPFALRAVVARAPLGIFKPSLYKKAWKQSQEAKQQQKQAVTSAPAVKKDSKLDKTTSPQAAMNNAANGNKPAATAEKKPAAGKKNNLSR